MIKMLKDFYQEERKQEYKQALEVIASDKGKIRRELLGNFDWVKNVVDTDQIMIDCKREGLKRVPFAPKYHTRMSLFLDYLEKNSCFNISSSAEFNQWLNNSLEEFNKKITSGLEDKLLELASGRATLCLNQYPMDSAINKVRFRHQREACLVDEWPKLEKHVLTQALKDPLVIKLQMSSDVLRVKLESNRRRLQLRIIKEYFN